jgi:hypothetical protein
MVNRIKKTNNRYAEKEVLLGLAVTLISSGMALIQDSKIVEGIILIMFGFVLLVLRGYLKGKLW